MKNKNLTIYGIGRFAEYVKYVFDNDSEYEVSGFCIERSFHQDNIFSGFPLRIFEDLSVPNTDYLFIAVGQNHIRKRIFKEAKNKGFRMATYVSSKAIVWPNLQIGENSFIAEGSAIQPFVTIGNNSIHFGSRIGHHSTIGDHTLLSHNTVGGNVTIGEETFIGMNSAVKQNITIAPRNIIGMNVSIEKNTEENAIYSSPRSKKRAIGYEKVKKKFLQ